MATVCPLTPVGCPIPHFSIQKGAFGTGPNKLNHTPKQVTLSVQNRNDRSLLFQIHCSMLQVYITVQNYVLVFHIVA